MQGFQDVIGISRRRRQALDRLGDGDALLQVQVAEAAEQVDAVVAAAAQVAAQVRLQAPQLARGVDDQPAVDRLVVVDPPALPDRRVSRSGSW